MATVHRAGTRRQVRPPLTRGRRARLRRPRDGGVLPLRPHRRAGRGGRRPGQLPARRRARRRRDPPALPHRPRRRARPRAGRPAVPGDRSAAAHEEARVFRAGGPGTGPAGVLHRAPRVLQPATASTARTAADYPDNRPALRLLRARRAARRCPAWCSGPVLLHAHDWHTALVPVYLRTTLAHERFARTRHDRAVGAQSRVPGPLPARGRCPTSGSRGSSSTGSSSSGTGR